VYKRQGLMALQHHLGLQLIPIYVGHLLLDLLRLAQFQQLQLRKNLLVTILLEVNVRPYQLVQVFQLPKQKLRPGALLWKMMTLLMRY
jgi:hypothetical protein